MEFRDQPIDAALEGWNELCSAVAAASTKSGGRLKYRHPEDFGVLIQVEEPPRALRLEYSPELKKLRYNTGISGWQELHVVKVPEHPVVLETPYGERYTIQEFCNLLLEQLEKSPF
ncbi:MAG TPA: hypothetical protein VEV41_28405 [Terriglobales bacterium]|nr:hypothetical protein [Terriglobales bacterium]